VSGRILLLFAILFFWMLPHFFISQVSQPERVPVVYGDYKKLPVFLLNNAFLQRMEGQDYQVKMLREGRACWAFVAQREDPSTAVLLYTPKTIKRFWLKTAGSIANLSWESCRELTQTAPIEEFHGYLWRIGEINGGTAHGRVFGLLERAFAPKSHALTAMPSLAEL
jgi:hypothetical protein